MAIKVLRAVLIALVFLIVGFPIISYVMLSTDWAQVRMRNASLVAIERLLGTKADIEKVSYSPFNRLKLQGITLVDDNADTCLSIAEVQVRVELLDLLFSQRLIVDYATVDSLRLTLNRPAPGAPLNIAGIISRFNKNDQKKESSSLGVRLNNIDISNSSLAYNVLSADTLPAGRFDKNHIEISDFNIDIYAPVVSNYGYAVRIRSMSATEKSGFKIANLRTNATLTPRHFELAELMLELPNSLISFAPTEADLSNGYASLASWGTEIPASIEVQTNSHVYLPDLQAFAPILGKLDVDANLGLLVSGIVSDFSVQHFYLSDSKGYLDFSLSAEATGLPDTEMARVDNAAFNLQANSRAIASIFPSLGLKMGKTPSTVMAESSRIDATGHFAGSIHNGELDITVNTAKGGIDAVGSYQQHNGLWTYDAAVTVDQLNIGALIGQPRLGIADAEISSQGSIAKGRFHADANAEIMQLVYNGYAFQNIGINAQACDTLYAVDIESCDPNLDFVLSASMAQYGKKGSTKENFKVEADIRHADLDAVNLWNKYPEHALTASINGNMSSESFSRFDGKVQIVDLQYVDNEGEGLRVDTFLIEADRGYMIDEIAVKSDFLNGSLQGSYNFSTIEQVGKDIIAEVYPNLVSAAPPEPKGKKRHTKNIPLQQPRANNFVFDFTVDQAENVCRFFHLPVIILDPVDISGEVSQRRKWLNLSVDAQWLLQGDKLVRNSYLTTFVDGEYKNSDLYLTSFMPTKKGPMNLIANIAGQDGKLLADIDWEIVRDIPINGEIKFVTQFERNPEDNAVTTRVDFEPGQINFGDAVWNIQPSTILYADKYLSVDGFSLQTVPLEEETAHIQKVAISGTASDQPDDVLNVDISNVRLIEIFETLEIDKALLCGEATGSISVSNLFTKEPDIRSHSFYVAGIGYNRCVLGDADIKLGFDVAEQAFWLDAVLMQEDDRHSTIVGYIKPATEELDLRFDADHVKVGFMQPFMEAFCSSVEGYATGKAHLFGTFKYIDLESQDLVADALKLKIDFTNTWYSVHNAPLTITPGLISIPTVDICDEYGHSALLTGWVKHEFFKKPEFDFDIRDARDFLCYDMPRSDEYRWWGTVYGNGGAHVDGKPGIVNIGVSMTTQAHSKFTFELSDAEVAEEYSFITFRDATPEFVAEEYYDMVVESKSEDRAKRLKGAADEDSPTAYNMNIQVDITPQALVTIVMDPVGGDEIRAYGSGQLRMFYGSRNDVLTLNGKYTLESGDYNFTLQDIIIREFKIRAGSSIQFDGDPYAAKLDIDAIYQTNANLSDLDESFLNDKDLNRTNVPVYAVMKVTGNMLQPDISFDLEFPTLTDDVARKVHSIISTEDMMSRQIIYLLALNRFYTPDYMSTTKGNELFSVASSTISSQLSSMLGKLSDNWSIAPNLRSDRGDFSDVEVDVNLSSRLLNNRLLFNGNFGYRDKSLNTNQFVGDFDVEYLLNRAGTLRLKAYNRYNDQNYYLRTAQTTQGIGIVVRRDFDNLLKIFSGNKKKASFSSDSVPALNPDSIPKIMERVLQESLED